MQVSETSTSAPIQAQNQTVLYDAKCASCGKWTKVIFPPDGKRPIYCKACLKKTDKDRSQPANSVNSINKEKEAPVIYKEKETPKISLQEAIKKEAVSFSPSRKPAEIQDRTRRKEVNVEELKKTIEESLKKNTPPSSPGENSFSKPNDENNKRF